MKEHTHTIFGLLEQTQRRGECLIWTGGQIDGLPTVRVGQSRVSAKKVMLELLGKPKPVPQAIAANTCKCRECMTPDHLYWSVQVNGTTAKTMTPEQAERELKEAEERMALPIVVQAKRRVERHVGNPFAQLLSMAG